MLRQTRKRRGSYVVTPRQIVAAETNEKMVNSVVSLMREEKTRAQLTFDKVAPLVNEIFCALANYDIRFEFGSLSLDSCHVEKVWENEYTVLCPLKELPEECMRLEGKEGTGVMTVRLSRRYEDSIDKVCWEDVSLPPDGKGCRYFSTKKLLEVLVDCLKHAINDVISNDEENNNGNKSVTCKQKNETAFLHVKVFDHCLRVNLLPCIPLNREIIKSLSMDGRISRVTKHMKLETTECVYLVGKPLPNHPEKLWRITVNNIENNIVRKIFDLTECGSHCLFAVTLINEQFFAEKKNKNLVPYYLTRMTFLEQFLKFPNENYWKPGHFTVRVEGLLRSLEGHLCKKDFRNIFTGVNIVEHREKDNLAEILRDVARLRTQFRVYFG